MLSLLMKLDRGNDGAAYGKSLKIIGCVGTAPLSAKLHREFEARYGIDLYESYGLSETLFVSTQSPKWNEPIGSVGTPLTSAHIAFGSDAELLVSAPWNYIGYIKQRHEEPAPDGPFVSGDLGRVDEKGYLYITGRKKDIIIRGGVNLSPRHIEEFLNERMAFEEAVIAGFQDDIIGERVVCFYVPHPAGFSSEDRRRLLADIRAQLGKDSVIDEFVEQSEIPKNTNGKVDMPALRSSYKRS